MREDRYFCVREKLELPHVFSCLVIAPTSGPSATISLANLIDISVSIEQSASVCFTGVVSIRCVFSLVF